MFKVSLSSVVILLVALQLVTAQEPKSISEVDEVVNQNVVVATTVPEAIIPEVTDTTAEVTKIFELIDPTMKVIIPEVTDSTPGEEVIIPEVTDATAGVPEVPEVKTTPGPKVIMPEEKKATPGLEVIIPEITETTPGLEVIIPNLTTIADHANSTEIVDESTTAKVEEKKKTLGEKISDLFSSIGNSIKSIFG